MSELGANSSLGPDLQSTEITAVLQAIASAKHIGNPSYKDVSAKTLALLINLNGFFWNPKKNTLSSKPSLLVNSFKLCSNSP